MSTPPLKFDKAPCIANPIARAKPVKIEAIAVSVIPTVPINNMNNHILRNQLVKEIKNIA